MQHGPSGQTARTAAISAGEATSKARDPGRHEVLQHRGPGWP